ncbi:MAG: hypothetical protein J3K34DRAFT_459147 [Monoraphidium minutum]|nr:MAG: hypothetical protein J3K34DRAFT_459147 [Monoraphidium minutum]
MMQPQLGGVLAVSGAAAAPGRLAGALGRCSRAAARSPNSTTRAPWAPARPLTAIPAASAGAGHIGFAGFDVGGDGRAGVGCASFAGGAGVGPAPSAGRAGVGCATFASGGGVGAASFAGATGAAAFAARPAAAGAGGAAQLRERLRRYGLAGLLAYGLLNTAYYSCMFLFVWVYVAKVPPGLGLKGAAAKFLEVFALTWGGSQVTKVARAAGALALAPLVDRLLDATQRALRLGSKRRAFGAVVGGCVSLALLLFAGVVAAYA